MALIMPGPNVSDLTGSIGGTTYARNRYGLYARHRVVPTDPNTTRQAAARSRMSNYAPEWMSLDPEVRAEWSAYAAAVPWVNRLGQTIHLTGMQWWIKSTLERVTAGLSPITDTAPALYTRIAADSTLSISAVNLSGDDEVTVTFNDSLPWCDSPKAAMAFYVSPGANASHTYNSRYIYCGKFLGSAQTPPQSGKELNDIMLTSGQRYDGAGVVWFRVIILGEDGRSSSPMIVGPYPTS